MNKKLEKLFDEINWIKDSPEEADISSCLKLSYDLIGSLIYEISGLFNLFARQYSLSDHDKEVIIDNWDIYHGKAKEEFIALYCEFGLKKAQLLMEHHYDDRTEITKQNNWL